MAAEMNAGQILKGAIGASRINNGTIRAAAVLETDNDGCVVSRVVDVRDVEERKADCPEVLLMDKETEQEILRRLKGYRNTCTYIAVMVTLMFITYMFDQFGHLIS